MNTLYRAADVFFFTFHILLIFFNLFGWIFKPLRKWNRLTLGLTAFSWLGLGIFYGWGYCFLTDWHWQVREKLGYEMSSNSYVHFLLTTLFPVSISESAVDVLTATLFTMAVVASTFTYVRDFRRKGRDSI
jgi:hypothetical protein